MRNTCHILNMEHCFQLSTVGTADYEMAIVQNHGASRRNVPAESAYLIT